MNEYIFGVHDYHPDISSILREKNKTAWIVHTTAIGVNPNDTNGGNFNNDRTTAIVRINNGYGSAGTIPLPHLYEDFSKRAANFVANSQGISYVVIANEIVMPWDYPEGQVITLENYLNCYRLCYQKIKSVAPQVKIAPQAPGLWNPSTPDSPDWVKQLPDQLNALGNMVDWIAIHAYSRGYGLDSFNTGRKMDAPWNHHYNGWETLYEYMEAIPQSHRNLPVIVTEVNGNDNWRNNNSGWIQKMYSVVNEWNENPSHQKILGACLFRWAEHDEQWDFSKKSGSVDDFKQSLNNDYRHNFSYQANAPVEVLTSSKTFKQGSDVRVTAESGLNLRKSPNGEVLELLPFNTVLKVLAIVDEWVLVETVSRKGFVHSNYIAV